MGIRSTFSVVKLSIAKGPKGGKNVTLEERGAHYAKLTSYLAFPDWAMVIASLEIYPET